MCLIAAAANHQQGWTATYPNNSAVKDRVSLPSVVTFVDWGTTGLDALMDTESMMTTTMVDMLLR